MKEKENQINFVNNDVEETVKGYMMAEVTIGIPNSHKCRTLLDSGAMPSIISEDAVPLGTKIEHSTVTLTGVSNTNIQVAGETLMLVEIGGMLFRQKLIVVPVGAMVFPQKSKMILGNNFFAKHNLGLEPFSWSITHEGKPLADMLPAWIEDTLYSSIKFTMSESPPQGAQKGQVSTDILSMKNNFDLDKAVNRSMPVGHRRAEAHPCTTDTEPTIVLPETPLRPKGRTRDSDKAPPKSEKLLDPAEFPSDTPYAVIPNAFYEIKTGTQQIKVRLQHKDSSHPIRQDNDNSYVIISNMYQPGVMVQDTITSGILTVSVRNMNAQTAVLCRDIPIAYAYIYSESEEVATILDETQTSPKPLKNEDPRAQTILSLASLSELTERAFDGNPDKGDSDMLDDFMEYDLSEVKDEEVVYYESRFSKVLELLNVDKWELTEDQKHKALDLLKRKQSAYYVAGEKLNMTHLLKHDIELVDENAIVHNDPR